MQSEEWIIFTSSFESMSLCPLLPLHIRLRKILKEPSVLKIWSVFSWKCNLVLPLFNVQFFYWNEKLALQFPEGTVGTLLVLNFFFLLINNKETRRREAYCQNLFKCIKKNKFQGLGFGLLLCWVAHRSNTYDLHRLLHYSFVTPAVGGLYLKQKKKVV